MLVVCVALGEDDAGEKASMGAGQSFAQGNTLYAEGDYRAAASAYEALLKTGFQSRAVYYNLGNAYLQLDDPGRAVLCYRRALLIAPRDADTLHNLNYAESQLAYQSSASVDTWMHALLAWTWSRITLNELLVLTMILYWIAAGVGVVRLSSRRRRVTVALWALIALLCLAAALTYGKWHRDYGSGAAIVVAEADMLSGPGPSFDVLARLRSGAEVRILQTQGQYCEVRTDAGGRGWMLKQHLELIGPREDPAFAAR